MSAQMLTGKGYQIDECAEVTPATVRIRKVILNAGERNRARGKNK